MQLTIAHWVYLIGVLAILGVMIARQNVVIPAVLATFLTAALFSGSVVKGVVALFTANLVAASELFSIFLIIALMVALLNALRDARADMLLVQPFQNVMWNGHISFWVLVGVTYVLSLFFWPTPVVPLLGAILFPAAIRAGLPAIGVGAAVAIAGQGMALSSDYVIRFQPGLSAKASGAPMEQIANQGLVLSLITGGIALILAYLAIRRQIVAPNPQLLANWERREAGLAEKPDEQPVTGSLAIPEGELAAVNTTVQATVPAPCAAHAHADASRPALARLFATIVPIVFAVVVTYMLLGQFTTLVPTIRGGDAAALIGGSGLVLLIFITILKDPKNCLGACGDYITEGLVFAFKVMGVVLPIAGFFFLGNEELSSKILGMPAGQTAPGFFFDIIQAGQSFIPQSKIFVSFGVLIVGALTGLDGSGSSGLPLTGALSGALAPAVGMNPSTLAAIGQMGCLWSGGGVLVPWTSLLAVAGFARVPAIELAAKCFWPVILGLIVSTLFAALYF